MAKVKIDETILEDAALIMSGGRLCLRWAADAWDARWTARRSCWAWQASCANWTRTI